MQGGREVQRYERLEVGLQGFWNGGLTKWEDSTRKRRGQKGTGLPSHEHLTRRRAGKD